MAVYILWDRANEYKMKKDWISLSATLEQLAKLQPRYISVWQFQAWNVSYNCANEFDDYRDRYAWVIKGIRFLREGIAYNQYEPQLLWDQGWFTSHRIGRADEKVEFRRLFRLDDEFHESLPFELRDPTRDNWLCGKQCFLAAEALHEAGHKIKGKGPLIFFSNAPMCQIYYADGLEADGTFGEVAIQAWARAAEDWYDHPDSSYGAKSILTTFRDPRTGEPLSIHLNDKEAYLAEAHRNADEVDKLAPGVRAKIEQEKRDALPPKEREALDTPPARRTSKQHELALVASQKIGVTHTEVAERVEGPQRLQALKHANEAAVASQMANYIDRYREIVNFEYWRLRCKVERTKTALEAREHIYKADQAGLLPMRQAREDYEKGFALWRKLLDEFPDLKADQTTGEELVEVINRYKELLGRMEDRLPPNFVLQDVLDRWGSRPR